MEHASCPISGKRNFTPYLTVPDRFDPYGKPWHLVKSADSGLVMLDPRPEPAEAGRFYPEERYDPYLHASGQMSSRDRTYLFLRSMLMRRKAAIVMKGNRKNPDETMILEVGCSTGDLLAGLHRMEGIPVNNLFGIETNAKAAGIARSRGIRQIAESDLVDTLFDRKFDRIVFWHVLEHLHRPGETLKKTAGLLSPEGRLIVVLPNLDSFDAAHYGKGWIAYDAPRHLYNFTPASLTRLLAAYGFSIVSIRPYLPDSIYNAWHSEKLASELEGRRFGIRSGAAAALNAIRAILSGIIAEKASGIVCTAHRTDHDS